MQIDIWKKKIFLLVELHFQNEFDALPHMQDIYDLLLILNYSVNT